MLFLIVGCVGLHSVVLVVLAAGGRLVCGGDNVETMMVLSGFARARRRHRWKVVFGVRLRERTQHGCCCCTFGASRRSAMRRGLISLLLFLLLLCGVFVGFCLVFCFFVSFYGCFVFCVFVR